MSLSQDKQLRKAQPIARGALDYFPDAIASVANVSFVANEQHNPGEPMHWARGKSTDHADALARHLIDRGKFDDDGLRHSAKVAWRALALLQEEIEAEQAPRRKTVVDVGTIDETLAEYAVRTVIGQAHARQTQERFLSGVESDAAVEERIVSLGGVPAAELYDDLGTQPVCCYDGDWNTPDQGPGFWRIKCDTLQFIDDSGLGTTMSIETARQFIEAGRWVPNTFGVE